MLNKVITILDINNIQNQNIETLIVANILEKKCNKITIMDINPYKESLSFFSLKQCKEKDEIYTTKVFDRCNYIFPSVQALMAKKMNNLAKSQADKNDILLINSNQLKFDTNTFFLGLSTTVIVFADINQTINDKLLKLFLQHEIVNKHIYVYVYNYDNNIQNTKTYLDLTRRFKSDKIIFNTIKEIPKFKTLNEISEIDPWLDIYKQINKII